MIGDIAQRQGRTVVVDGFISRRGPHDTTRTAAVGRANALRAANSNQTIRRRIVAGQDATETAQLRSDGLIEDNGLTPAGIAFVKAAFIA